MAEYLGLVVVYVLMATAVAAAEATLSKGLINDQPQVACFFVFGDSVFDNGNNNNLETSAKVNYLPYGIDFPDGPTGRFSNGRNIPDFIAQFLGLKDPIPPFASAVDSLSMFKGVNYASGGAGIRDETGQNLGERVSLSRQLEYHKTTIANITKLLGHNSAGVQKHLNKCLYTINIGSNDYINNYFMPQSYNSSRRYSPESFAASLAQIYSAHLHTLYKHGARRIALFGLSRIGCTPRMVKALGGMPCAENVNTAVQFFNRRLLALVDELNRSLAGAKFIYIDMYGHRKTNFALLGFTVTNSSCCKVEKGQELCSPYQAPCPIRNQNLFWDDVHSTEATNLLAAKNAYGGSLLAGTANHPYNIAMLIRLP